MNGLVRLLPSNLVPFKGRRVSASKIGKAFTSSSLRKKNTFHSEKTVDFVEASYEEWTENEEINLGVLNPWKLYKKILSLKNTSLFYLDIYA